MIGAEQSQNKVGEKLGRIRVGGKVIEIQTIKCGY